MTYLEIIKKETDRLKALEKRIKEVGSDCKSDGAFMEFASLQTELRNALPNLVKSNELMVQVLEENLNFLERLRSPQTYEYRIAILEAAISRVEFVLEESAKLLTEKK